MINKDRNKHNNLSIKASTINKPAHIMLVACIFIAILASLCVTFANALNSNNNSVDSEYQKAMLDASDDLIDPSDSSDASNRDSSAPLITKEQAVSQSNGVRADAYNQTDLKKYINDDVTEVITVHTSSSSFINLKGSSQSLELKPKKVKIIRTEKQGMNDALQINPINKRSNYNIFNVTGGAKLTLENIILQGGGVSAINAENSTIVLNNTAITLCAYGEGGAHDQHRNETGGGIKATSSKVFMTDSIIARNAAYCGGGIVVKADAGKTRSYLIADRCSFSENRSLGNAGGGGALEVQITATAFVNNSCFDNNTSTEIGGAVNVSGGNTAGKFFCLNTTFCGNGTIQENKYGGALGGNLGDSQTSGYAEICCGNCLFAYNYSYINGQIRSCDIGCYNGTNRFKLFNCTYNNLQGQSVVTADCDTVDASAAIFYKTIDSYLYYGKASSATKDYTRAIQARTSGGEYDLYPPITKDSAVVSKDWKKGKAYATYFKANTSNPDQTIIAFKSKSNTKAKSLVGNNTEYATDPDCVVTRTFENINNRKPHQGTEFYFPGCSGVLDYKLWLLKLCQAEGGQVTGANQTGDLIPDGSWASLRAYPADGYTFAYWIIKDASQTRTETSQDYKFQVFSDTEVTPVFRGTALKNKAYVYLSKDGMPLKDKPSVDLRSSDGKKITATFDYLSGSYITSGLAAGTTYTVYVGGKSSKNTVKAADESVTANPTNILHLNQYTITFDAITNGMSWSDGTKYIDKITDYDGVLRSFPDNPTKGGDFCGWYTGKSDGDSLDKDKVYSGADRYFAHAYKAAEDPKESQEFTYNRKAQGPSEGEGYKITGGQKTATDYGTYTCTATLEDGYYWSDKSVKPKTITYKIKKAEVTVDVSGTDASKEYNGKNQSNKNFNISSDSEIFLKSEISTSQNIDASGKNVGLYTCRIDTIKFTCSNNNLNVSYNLDSDHQETRLEITPRDLTNANINIDPSNYTYKGSNIDASFSVTDIVNGVNIITKEDWVVVDGSSGKDAGEYTLNIEAAKSHNYKNSNNAKWYINKASMTIEISGHDASYEYNGKEHTVDGFDAKPTAGAITLFDNDKLKLKDEFDISVKGTDYSKDSYSKDLEADFFTYTDDNIDYEITISKLKPSNKIQILQRDLAKAKLVADPSVYEYNGKDQSVKFSVEDIVDDNNIIKNEDWEIESGASGKDASSYVLNIKATASHNYHSTNHVDWIILPAIMTLKISGHKDSVEYDGSSHSVSGYDVEVIEGKDFYDDSKLSPGVDSDEVKVTGTNANTYEKALDKISWAYNDPNIICNFEYSKDFSTIKLEIRKAPLSIDIQGDDASFVYDGQEHWIFGFRPVLTGGNEKVYDHLKVSTANLPSLKRTDKGTDEWKIDPKDYIYDDDNIDASFSSDTTIHLTIFPRSLNEAKVLFDPSSASYVYTGDVVSAKFEVRDASEGRASIIHPSDWEVVDDTDKGTDVKEYTLKIKATDAGNYIGEIEIPWYIVLRNIDIYIDGSSQTVTYDASQHTLTDFDSSCSDPLFDASKIIYTPANVSGIDASTYPMKLEPNNFKYDDKNISAKFFIIKDGLLTIEPAPLEIITDSAEKPYDGKPLTAPGHIEGLVGQESATLNTTGSQTEVGESDNTYKIQWDGSAKESNYKIDKENLGVLQVVSAPSEVSQTGDNNIFYILCFSGLIVVAVVVFMLRKHFSK